MMSTDLDINAVPGVEDMDAIDGVNFDKNRGAYILHLFEKRNLDAPLDQLMQIQDKVLGYLGYVFSGDMQRDYPDAGMRPLRFQLNVKQSPTGPAAKIIEETAEQLGIFGIGFDVKVSA
jgi:hypothetical protein